MGRFEEFIGVNFWTALFVLLNTLAIFFVARKYLFGPVRKMVEDRQHEIDTMYQDANDAKAKAEQMANEYQQKLSQAQSTAEKLVKDAVLRGQKQEEDILQKAGQEAAALLEKAQADVQMEKKKAMNEAKDEISSMAVAVAEKIVGRELNQKDQKDLVDQFIDELGDET